MIANWTISQNWIIIIIIIIIIIDIIDIIDMFQLMFFHNSSVISYVTISRGI
jgi:hypothetical protein